MVIRIKIPEGNNKRLKQKQLPIGQNFTKECTYRSKSS